MTNHELDLAILEIHESVKKFLTICSNASEQTVGQSALDDLLDDLLEESHPNQNELRNLKAEIGRAYKQQTSGTPISGRI
jgi:hypothetical protein